MNKIVQWWRRTFTAPAIQPLEQAELITEDPKPKGEWERLLDRYPGMSEDDLLGKVLDQSEKWSTPRDEQTYHNLTPGLNSTPIPIPESGIPYRDGKPATIYIHVNRRGMVYQFDDLDEGFDELIDGIKYDAHERIAYFRSNEPIDLIKLDAKAKIKHLKKIKKQLSE